MCIYNIYLCIFVRTGVDGEINNIYFLLLFHLVVVVQSESKEWIQIKGEVKACLSLHRYDIIFSSSGVVAMVRFRLPFFQHNYGLTHILQSQPFCHKQGCRIFFTFIAL